MRMGKPRTAEPSGTALSTTGRVSRAFSLGSSSMKRLRPPRPPLKIAEIIYGVLLCRGTHIDLKWLDKPARDYLVTHQDDGTVRLEPLTADRYVVRAADDGQVVLGRPLNPKWSRVQVRHAADGRITIIPWQYVPDEYPSGLRERGLQWASMDTERTIVRYEDGFCTTVKDVFIPEDWDRTKEGLDRRSRSLRDAQLQDMLGREGWERVQAAREKAKRYREIRKESAL